MSLGGKFVGDLHYDKTKHTPILIIGHHILHGKVVDCERPFVAIEKKSSLANSEGTCAHLFIRTREWRGGTETESFTRCHRRFREVLALDTAK